VSTQEPYVRYNRTIGTAKELAVAINAKLRELGLKHFNRATERTVRYYRTRRLIDPPHGVQEDLRKAVFSELQMYQACLLLALGARGYKLSVIKRMHGTMIRRHHDGVDLTPAIDALRALGKCEASVDDIVSGRNDTVK